MKLKLVGGIFSGILLLLVFVGLHSSVHAQSINYTADANWDQASCIGNINGLTSASKNSYGVAQGDNFNLTLVNQSSITLNTSITLGSDAPIYSTLASGATYSHTYTDLQSNLQIQAYPDPTQPCGYKFDSGMVTVIPGTATISCATVLGNKGYGWDITGSYTNGVVQASLFEGSTNVESYTDSSGAIIENFVAGTSATTFYFYNGYTASDRLLAQATCQPPPSSSTSDSTPASSSTTKSSSSTTTTTPATSSTPTSDTTSTATSTGPVQLKSVDVAGQAISSGSPIELNQSQSLTLSGVSIPGGLITLTIHSTPRTVTTMADSSGAWSYVVSGLAPGNHYVQASVTAPGSKQASAATTLISFKVDPVVAVVAKASSKMSLLIPVVALAVLAGGGGFYFIYRKKHQPSLVSHTPVTLSPTAGGVVQDLIVPTTPIDNPPNTN